MSSKVTSLPVPARQAAALPVPKAVAPAPIELDASLLKHVSGGAAPLRTSLITADAPKVGW